MFPSPSLPAGFELFPRPSLPAGFELSPRPSPPAGRDFGPVRTCGAFPPTAARRAPHRSRSHGRLRRPKSLPIRHSPAAAQCSSHWAGGIASVLTSWLHRFASLGLKSGIAAGIAPVLAFWLHRFASLGLKSRIAARFLPRMAPRLQRLPILGLKSGITAVPSCRRVEWPAFGRSLPPRCRVRFQFSSSESRTVPPA